MILINNNIYNVFNNTKNISYNTYVIAVGTLNARIYQLSDQMQFRLTNFFYK